jgi:hypothetical protein
MQRITESAGREGALARLYADRPAAMSQATERALDQIAPRSANPGAQGVRAQRAAEGAIQEAQAGVNAATAYPYQVMQSDRIPTAQMRALSADPLFQHTLREIRNNPALNQTIQHLPDDAVGVVDLVRQRARELGEGAQSIGQATPSNLIARNYGDVQRGIDPALDAATAGGNSLVRNIQTDLRRSQVEPLTTAPTGTISKTQNIGEQGRALMGPEPSSLEVQRSASVMMPRDEGATRAVVREHLGRVADKTVHGLDAAAQPDQYGGAKFAKSLRGDPRVAENIGTAIETVSGQPIREDIRRLADVLQATGNRQRPGSMTAFNAEVMDDAKRSALVDLLTKPLAQAQEKYGRARLGRRLDELDRMFASGPDGIRRLEQMARAGAGADTGTRALARALLAEKSTLQTRE